MLTAALALLFITFTGNAWAQTPATADKWKIIDNSFLVEEAFNQESDVFQNIFTWTRGRDGAWQASFTQEWPAPNMSHQFSYTIPFSGTGRATGLNDVLLTYRYQLVNETAHSPAIAPKLNLVLPSGREGDGLGNGATGLQFNIPASKQFGDLYVHVNGGANWLHGGDWTTLVGASVIWQVVPMWNLMFETVGEPGQSITWSPGFRYGWNLTSGQVVVGAAVPVTHDASRPATAAFLTYFSYEPRFR
jgi:hypothetical protein